MTLYKQCTQKYFLFHFVKTFLNTFMLHTKMSLLFLVFKKKKKIKNKLCVANQTSPTDSSFTMYPKIFLLFKTPSQLQYFIPRQNKIMKLKKHNHFVGPDFNSAVLQI